MEAEAVVEEAKAIEEVVIAPVVEPEEKELTLEGEVKVEEAPEIEVEILEEESVEPEIGEEQPEEVEEEAVSFDELFALRPEVLDMVGPSEEDELEDEQDIKKKRKKKKQRKFVQVEYDPDHNLMMVKKKHKRPGFDWDEDW
jgi:hypothetical protein